MSVCLSQEAVERYAAGSCSANEQQAIEAHLAECESCRQQIGSTRSNIGSHQKPESSDTALETTRALPDEYPTEPIADATIAPHGEQDYTKSLESMIEGYEILEEMPRGGQAAVYKAIHTATRTKVAVKVLLPTLLASARARHYFEREAELIASLDHPNIVSIRRHYFEREAELIASLDHPNIVSIRDSGIIHHQYYFVMQYIEGQPLERYARLQKLSFREKVVLLNKTCTAITYAHQQGVIHRDLKFANILVDKRGEPHVLDFGLAKAVGLSEEAPDEAVATMTGQLAGTLSTMSPEQAAGRPDQIDVRTDVYSLGVMLYRMLTGQYPYEVVGSTLEVLQNIQKAEPIRPRQIDRKFDSDVEAILLTALAKERTERYQSTAELQSDIEHWLDGRPIRVKSISTMYLLRKIITRHRYTSTVAALLLLIILGFAYVCFDLYITAKTGHQNYEKIASQWKVQADKVPTLNRRMFFGNILDMWHAGLIQEANRLTRLYLTAGSKEKKAAIFLLNPNLLAEKEPEFRQSLSDDDTGFVDFIIGEHHLQAGNHKEALKACQDSFTAIRQSRQRDTWVEMKVRSRLNELRDDEPAKESEKQKVQG
jgi:serine/threonine protein kinase